MNSTLKFYKATDLKIEKNALIDNIWLYLATLQGTYTVNNFQYIKHGLSIVVKIDYDQEGASTFDYNYCTIKNDNSNITFYYYVMDTQWTAQHTVSITLGMDTVNTLAYCNDESAYHPDQFLPDTQIKREHRDRFVQPTTWSGTGTLRRIIDFDSEGIAPVQEKEDDIVVEDDSYMDWYILYKTREDLTEANINNPIAVYLIPEKSVAVQNTTRNPVRWANSFTEGHYYYITSGTLNFSNSTSSTTEYSYIIGNNYTISCPGYGTVTRRLEAVVIYKNSGQLYIAAMYNAGVKFNNSTNETEDSINDGISLPDSTIDVNYGPLPRYLTSTTTWTVGPFRKFKYIRFEDNIAYNIYESVTSLIDRTASYIVNNIHAKMIFDKGSSVIRTNNIDTIDRLDSRNMKLIKLPYCPVNHTIVNNIYSFGSDWLYDFDSLSGHIKYQGIGVPNFISVNAVSINLNEINKTINSNLTIHDAKNMDFESKLLHSDFYTVRLSYDNFTIPVQLERYLGDETNIKLDFKQTSTINSTMAFKLKLDNYKEVSDYEKFLVISRNNEEALYNNDYVNYIRNQKRFDEKANNIQAGREYVNAALSVGETAGRLAAGFKWNPAQTLTETLPWGAASSLEAEGVKYWGVDENNLAYRYTKPGRFTTRAGGPLEAGLVTQQVIGSAGSVVQTISNCFFNSAARANQMAAKQAQLASQSTAFQGSNDVDIMSWYSGNRLHLMRYNTDERLKESLYDVFDLTGYSHNRYETPDVNSRIWYNFIQCTPSVEHNESSNMKQVWIDDMKTRYELGVTVYHNVGNEWNLNQDYENYERWLVNLD